MCCLPMVFMRCVEMHCNATCFNCLLDIPTVSMPAVVLTWVYGVVVIRHASSQVRALLQILNGLAVAASSQVRAFFLFATQAPIRRI
jgi:hypothetical protein